MNVRVHKISWEKIETEVRDYLLSNLQNLPKRWVRWLASYFPDARIRKLCWQLTNVEMGEGTFANIGMIVVDDYQSGECLLSIGSHVSIAPGVIFSPISSHNNSILLKDHAYVASHLTHRKKIVVEDEVWIGAHVTILSGVRIGCCSIIGAGAVVTEDVPPYVIVAGVPARVIRKLDSEGSENFLDKA